VVVEPEVVPPVVSVPSCLHPTSAKQAASVSNAISFIVELLLFPYCERPGLLGQAGPYEPDFYPMSRTCQALFSPTLAGAPISVGMSALGRVLLE